MVKVANCVLSPSSAMKTVKNVDNNEYHLQIYFKNVKSQDETCYSH